MTTRLYSSKAVTSLAALLAAFGSIATASTIARADTPPPDYGPVDDPLSTMQLLRDDDVLLTLSTDDPGNPGGQLNWLSSIKTKSATGEECVFSLLSNACNQTTNTWKYESSPVSGRFFNTESDEVVTFPDGARTGQYTVDSLLGVGGAVAYSTLQFQATLPYGTNGTTTSQTAAADFTGDKLDDLLMVYSDYSTQFEGNGRARIATASDPNNPSAAFDFGDEADLGIPYGIRSVAAGDFNGDGQPEFAVLYVDNDQFPNIAVYSVGTDRSIHLEETNRVPDPVPAVDVQAPMQLVAGTFIPGQRQQLAMVATSSSAGATRVHLFDFTNADSPYYPYEKSSFLLNYQAEYVKLVAGQFDWTSQTQALAFMSTALRPIALNSQSDVRILTVGPIDYALSQAALVNVPHDIYGTNNGALVALDIAVGNFDNVVADTADAGTPTRSASLQLAIGTAYVWTKSSAGSQLFRAEAVDIFDVIDPTTNKIALTKRSVIPITSTIDGTGNITKMALNAADLQGRSLRLGPPVKIGLDRASPSVILAQPPMHVDYAYQNYGDPTPTVVNLSYAPGKFNSGFSSQSTQGTTASSTDTKSWSFAGKESVSTSFTVGTTTGGVLADGEEDTACFTAEQDMNTRSDQQYGTSTSVSENISSQTDTSDYIEFDEGLTYLYVYEVLGKTVCPSGQTTCADSARIPLTVMFSAPGAASSDYASAVSMDWYQPVWENGNLLSYPGSLKQLQYGMPNATTPQTDSKTFSTGDSLTQVTATWANSSDSTHTYSYGQTFAEDGSLSFEFAGGFWGGSGDFKASFDFGGSDGTEAVRTRSTSVSSSSTLTMNKAVQFADPSQYAYNFSPVVYGAAKPAGYSDGTDPITDGSGLPPPSPDQTASFGPLRTGFSVDPLSTNANTWFTHNYGSAGKPDIALNHPFRWGYSKTSTPANGAPIPPNCLGTDDGYMECAYQTARKPNDPFDDTFHRMRGFFIYHNGDPNPASPTNPGMQQASATAGDNMVLEARVYNYSLVPLTSKFHVRFYGMPWDKALGNAIPNTSSFLIGQYDGNGIPAFTTTDDVPNYVLANVHFDTTGRDNQDLVFWTVAWAEDASGNLLDELPGKGLTANPRTVTGPNFADFVNLEPQIVDQWPASTMAESGLPAMTSFSNNIGLYHQIFHINAPAPTGALGAARGLLDDPRSLVPSNPHALVTSLKPGESTLLTASVHNPGVPLQNAVARFYDGDPNNGGTLVGEERLTYMNTGDDHSVRMRYAPTACGTHNMYMKVGRHGQWTGATRTLESIQVACDAPGPIPASGGATDGGAPAAPGNGAAPAKDTGGCNVGPGETASVWALLAPLAAVIGALWRRRKRAA